MDNHKLARKMRELIEIEKHSTIDQEGKPLDSTWRALFCGKLISLSSLCAHKLIRTCLVVRFDVGDLIV